DREQVEKYAEGTPDPVVRNAALTVHVLDRDLADGRAMPRSQRRDEAVQLAIKRNLLDQFAAIGLESRAEIVDVYAAELGHEPVGDSRRNAAHDEIVNALLAPSADDVVSLFQLFEE